MIKGFVDRVFQQKPDKRIAFEFTGGEVTVYRHFLELCDYIKSKGGAVGFISNGSRTLRFWEDMRGRADHVCLSFHAEEGDADHFLEVVRTLHDNMRTHVNVMMHPDRWQDCEELAHRVTEIPGITLALQPLIVDFGDKLYEYTAHQQAVMYHQHGLFQKKIVPLENPVGKTWRGAMLQEDPDTKPVIVQAQELVSQKKNNWANWQCAAGVEQIIVDMDQSIWRGWCRQGGRIGHIADEDFRIPCDWVDCKKVFCHCNFDIMTTKVKS